MEKVGYIDIQTDTISASTMVYTELLEMFTALTVEFSFDYAGNVEGRKTRVNPGVGWTSAEETRKTMKDSSIRSNWR